MSLRINNTSSNFFPNIGNKTSVNFTNTYNTISTVTRTTPVKAAVPSQRRGCSSCRKH